MNYTEQLEKQNEELQQKLAASEQFHRWRDRRHFTRMTFVYNYYIIFSMNDVLRYIVSRYQAQTLIRNQMLNNKTIQSPKKTLPQLLRFHGEYLSRDLEPYGRREEQIKSIGIEVTGARVIGSILYDKILSRKINLYKKP